MEINWNMWETLESHGQIDSGRTRVLILFPAFFALPSGRLRIITQDVVKAGVSRPFPEIPVIFSISCGEVNFVLYMFHSFTRIAPKSTGFPAGSIQTHAIPGAGPANSHEPKTGPWQQPTTLTPLPRAPAREERGCGRRRESPRGEAAGESAPKRQAISGRPGAAATGLWRQSHRIPPRPAPRVRPPPRKCPGRAARALQKMHSPGKKMHIRHEIPPATRPKTALSAQSASTLRHSGAMTLRQKCCPFFMQLIYALAA